MTDHAAARAAAAESAFPDPGGVPEWPKVKRAVVIPLPARIDHEHDWREYAECKGTDTEVFFPEQGGSYDRALEACNNCPVSAQCLEAAMEEELSADKRYGMRGGLSAVQRHRLQRVRDGMEPGIKCGTHHGYRQHIAAREAPCQACRNKKAEYMRNRRASGRAG